MVLGYKQGRNWKNTLLLKKEFSAQPNKRIKTLRMEKQQKDSDCMDPIYICGGQVQHLLWIQNHFHKTFLLFFPLMAISHYSHLTCILIRFFMFLR
jgi:hypothetical protein